jgi:tetratricopeptide (TPR) repeat protein
MTARLGRAAGLALALSWAAPAAAARSMVATPEELASLEGGSWSAAERSGAVQLGVHPQFVRDCRAGLDLIFKRDYRGSRSAFANLDRTWTDANVAAVADALVWQAVMLENWDFSQAAQWKAASGIAREKLTKALEKPGNDAWEHFLLGATAGIESIQAAREERYLPALSLAFEAIDHIETAREVKPGFIDVKLADGLYNYWRTVLTKKSRLLPDFGDQRQLGIAQMQEVEAKGIFLGPAATFALQLTWQEEGDYAKAESSGKKAQAMYPNNVINNMSLGQTYVGWRKYESAMGEFQKVRTIDAANKRVHYYIGLTYLRMGKHDEAEASLRTYLASDYLEKWQKSMTHYRLGQVFYARKDLDKAEAAFKEAVAIDGNENAKRGLSDVATKRREAAAAQ